MKIQFQHYMNDIHLKRESEMNFWHKTGSYQHDSAKLRKEEKIQCTHTYIVDWQIHQEIEPNNRA
jgi:hypothetical protein